MARYIAVALASLVLLIGQETSAVTIRVPSAQPTIQAGLAAAVSGDTVLVACGTYYEHELAMPPGVVLTSEGGDPSCVTVDAERQGGILVCEGVGATASIIGLTMTRGDAELGGALFCVDSSPLIVDCRFLDNSADHGGAIYCSGDAAPAISGCSFEANSCFWGRGGAIACDIARDEVTISDCLFETNAADEGGALYCNYCSPTITACAFRENTATGSLGGAVSCWHSSLLLEACELVGNSAPAAGGQGLGGALWCCGFGDQPVLLDCVLAGNAAGTAGGAISSRSSLLWLQNCTLWGNSAPEGCGLNLQYYANCVLQRCIVAFGEGGAAVSCESNCNVNVGCCDVYGNSGGDWVGCLDGLQGTSSNFSADPLFCDPALGDFTLSSDSPCARANSPGNCGLIGALEVGCETAVLDVTWGALKAMFR